MTPDEFINDSIERGSLDGLADLNRDRSWIFLISEAEAYCDMEGIDSFIDKYGAAGVLQCAEAFRIIGASDIADGLISVSGSLPDVSEILLSDVNSLITERAGYDYEAIRRVAQDILTRSGAL